MDTTVPVEIDRRITAAAGGDRVSAESLCKEILPRVRNLVRYLVRGDSLADDIAQEALVAVLRGLHGYRGEGAFQSWVDRVVARTTFALIKKKRAEAAQTAPEDAAPGAHDERIDSYVLRRQLAVQLDKLPVEQRDALVLHFAVGMSIPEIAETTGTPFETVRSRIRLGKATLREAMGEGHER
jgi:RNA polymerase sigma-70 factor (ECF subfamily)